MRSRPRRWWVAVPSLYLVGQTFSTWAREALANGKNLNPLLVCSDASTGKGDTHVDDLRATVTTKPTKIKDWVQQPCGKKDLKVAFVTYQSGKVFAEAVGRAKFDVALLDEAHKTAGAEGKAYQHLLYQKNIDVRHRVFMTATERFYHGERDEVVGMNDERIYGKRYHHMDFAKAIEDGILADYTVIALGVTGAEAERYRQQIEERIYVDAHLDDGQELEPLTAEDLATAVALRKTIRQHKVHHAVSFHSRNRYARAFATAQNALNNVGLSKSIKTFRVSSEDKSGTRQSQIRGFEKAKTALISNARCLTEGVDVPGIDLVLFAQPRQSKVDIVQAVGRALRKPRGQDEKMAHVLVPLLTEDGDLDLEEVVEGTGFQNLVSVLKAMATVDGDVSERIKVVVGKERRKVGRERQSEDTDEEFARTVFNVEDFNEALRLRAWDRLGGLKSPRLTEEEILAWADAHHENTGKWPKRFSGEIHGVSGETWRNVDASLEVGGRGLPGGSSLARLLANKRGVRNQSDLPPLSIDKILVWADAHNERTGKWPNRKSGSIPEAIGENWGNINQALIKGLRSLQRGASLAQLLIEKRGHQHHLARPPLSIDEILVWAGAYNERTGKWPNRNSGNIPEAPGETWANVANAIYLGQRSLKRGSSLTQLLANKRGVRNQSDLPPLSIDKILVWADAHNERTGKWPNQKSGSIPEAIGETWTSIDHALGKGTRDLPGGSSLAQLLTEKRGVRNRNALPPFTIDKILGWADAHNERTGKWPNRNSGNIPEAPGETWANVDGALYGGFRSLPGGSSLNTLLIKTDRKKK